MLCLYRIHMVMAVPCLQVREDHVLFVSALYEHSEYLNTTDSPTQNLIPSGMMPDCDLNERIEPDHIQSKGESKISRRVHRGRADRYSWRGSCIGIERGNKVYCKTLAILYPES